jgi:hypothetical protein
VNHSCQIFLNVNSYLVDVTTLGDELVTDLDPGLQEVHVQLRAINTHHLGDIFTFLLVWKNKSQERGTEKRTENGELVEFKFGAHRFLRSCSMRISFSF